MNVLAGFSPIARALIVTAAIAIVLFFLQAAASIVAPILLGVFIAVVAAPSCSALTWRSSLSRSRNRLQRGTTDRSGGVSEYWVAQGLDPKAT